MYELEEKRSISLKTAVIAPFVVIFLLSISLVILVQRNSYEHAVLDLSEKQLSSLTENVRNNLTEYLGAPFDAGLAMAHTISYNHLYQADDTSKLQGYFLNAFQTLYADIPQLDVIGFGSEAADYIGFRKENDGSHTLMIQDDRTDSKLVIYRGEHISNDIVSVIPNYDPRIRPWYAPVAKERKVMWSSIYANADERQEITLSALSPVYDTEQFVGVMVTDIRINTFNAFLSQLREKTKAKVYIMDSEQRLVAHSGQGSVVSWGTEWSKKGERLLAVESADPIIKLHAERVKQDNLMAHPTSRPFELKTKNERYFSLLSPYTDAYGLTWFIGIAISESELLGSLPKSQQQSWLIGLLVSAIGMSFCLVIFSRITRPITATATAAKNLANGNWDSHMPKPGRIHETSLLVNAFNDMTNNLKASFKALQNQLVFDSLTKLYSREGLIDISKRQTSESGCLFILGVDRFRDINDSMGHYNGDQLLIKIAERLQTIFDDKYLLARTGGDEFAIYAPHIKQSEEMSLAVNRLQQLFVAPFYMNEESVVMKVSIGIVITDNDNNMARWLRNGSIALSNAKQDVAGISYYRPEMADASKFRTQMLAKIQDGLDSNEFVPYYQPIIELKSGEVIGAEALARWLSKQGIVSPLDFIPIAEDSGMIQEIGKRILLQSCRDCAQAIAQGRWRKEFQLHVNISVNQLSREDFVSEVSQVLAETGLSASNLTLEITESRLVESAHSTMDNMNKLRKLGIAIAIDDFGTGYSSLAYLHSLPFDCLKIDRTFVEKLNREGLNSSVVAAVVNITRGFNVNVVAEGVETSVQAELLMELGCTLAQGYLYSRPVPFDEWPSL
ncbi:EAL domain-containing protein [Vibrio sp. IRLE0018]|uniref:bifunctional diguanylate cyclase/phosphodiesterase n=1 Tax=Vibrio floridensis TaxID=2908007 RepID=UPI001F3A9C5F|nr:EAL domain-containing protein [Vibrio floridensis]MCF8780273.1 EAL domain-containing protein [Vibrio floridensis]